MKSIDGGMAGVIVVPKGIYSVDPFLSNGKGEIIEAGIHRCIIVLLFFASEKEQYKAYPNKAFLHQVKLQGINGELPAIILSWNVCL
jgi:hypothetical protein